jgi:D-glycero-alpha-D-manno-heptose-7-phosphate kinase
MMVRSRAPLRLGLGGGGTDVSPFSDIYGGSVLNATISFYAYATVSDRNDGKVRFYAADREESWEGEASSFIPIEGALKLHKGVYNRIVRDFCGGRPLPVTLTTAADVPAGSGLGASSTLVVAMVQALREYLALPLGEYDVAHLAYMIERDDVGLEGGKQDQYAACFGGFNFMEFYADRVIVNPLRLKRSIIAEFEAGLVLCYTGTSRESAEIIAQQVESVRARKSGPVEAMKEVKRDAQLMKELVLKGDLFGFAEVLGRSWESKKRMATRISNPHIDELYEIARRSGAYAGKVSGAGGGGFMMFMVDPTCRPKVIDALSRANGQVLTCHFTKDGANAWRV